MLMKVVRTGLSDIGATSEAYAGVTLWKAPHGIPEMRVRSTLNANSVFHLPQSTSPSTRILTLGAKNSTKMKAIMSNRDTMVVIL